MASPRRRGGLGTGLAAILPAAGVAASHPALARLSSLPTIDEPDPGAVRDSVISATLDVMRDTLDADCCGYLHQPLGEGGRVTVCTRAGLSLVPDGLVLLAAMKRVLDDDVRERPVAFPGFDALLVASNGPRSRGVHLTAWVGSPDASMCNAGRSLSRLFASVIHRLEASW